MPCETKTGCRYKADPKLKNPLPDMLPENIAAINLWSRINLIGAEVAFALTDRVLNEYEAELLARQFEALRMNEIRIAKVMRDRAEIEAKVNRGR